MNLLGNHVVDYPTPMNISYMWGFGSLSGLVLVIQIITGVFLAMHYTCDTELAFASVERIMRDVPGGFVLRYAHANGASFFFIAVFLHMARGIYYGSYERPRGLLWASGVAIFFLMIITAFIGYVLPYGQMSYWGATVITNFMTVIPLVGKNIVMWLWGNYCVENATLTRFFSLHYLLPFIITAVVGVHLVFLHTGGSNNRLGVLSATDKMAFYPYCYVKDLFVFLIMSFFLACFVFFAPNMLGHSDNYIEAMPLKTPLHIVPEWYFLVYYGILRCITSKTIGVLAMVSAILALLLLPLVLLGELRLSAAKPVTRALVVFFFMVCLLLGYYGGKPAAHPYLSDLFVGSILYGLFFVVGIPVAGLTRYRRCAKSYLKLTKRALRVKEAVIYERYSSPRKFLLIPEGCSRPDCPVGIRIGLSGKYFPGPGPLDCPYVTHIGLSRDNGFKGCPWAEYLRGVKK